MNAAELPNRRVEAWKYSDLRAVLAGMPLPAEGARPPAAQTLLDGVIERLALSQGHHALTTVAAGQTEVLVERLDMSALSASVREIRLQPGAELTRIVIQSAAQRSVVLDSAHVAIGAGARFRQFVLAEGATLARVETHVRLEGEGAEAELNGAYQCAGLHADLTSTIEHKVGGCITRQMIHGVAVAGGRAVFQGKIVVEPGAQKTDARQHHHGLLLQEGAEIFAKPELLIHADDVQCAHGNAIGGLDEDALFYMRARGIPAGEARALLIAAFLAQTIPDGVPDNVHEELMSRINYWLAETRP